MGPDEYTDPTGNPPIGQPRQPVPDFFASRAVVMPPPEPESAGGSSAMSPAYATPPRMWEPPQPGDAPTAAPGGVPTPAPWTGSVGTSRARRRRFVPAAAATVAALLAGALALAFSVNKGGAALSNTQMLALVHTASTGLSRSPATTFTMTMTLSGDGQQQTIHMSGFGSNDNREASFTATGPGISESSVFLDGVAYVQVPAQAISTNGGKPWIGVRSPNLTGEQQQLESGGPTGLLQSLADFGGTVKDDGSDSVHGVQTTKYTVELNLQSMIERESAVSGSSPSPLVNNPDLNQDFPMSIWIDKQGLPRELTMSFDIDGISMQAVAYFTPTSVVPTISAPPASEVNMLGSLSDFRSSLQQLGASS